eukprot:4820065-Prymnesium_polylepis.1
MVKASSIFGSTPEEVRLNWLRLVSISGFVGLNISLNFYNAAVLKADHQPGFHFPIFYTMWHMLASAFGCMVLMYFTPPETGYPSFKQLWEYRYVRRRRQRRTAPDNVPVWSRLSQRDAPPSCSPRNPPSPATPAPWPPSMLL